MSFLPSFFLGYHGCDKEIGLSILNKQKEHNFNVNSYDWLGHGIYFWENSPKRASEYATELSKLDTFDIKKPFVIGAVIDPGNCLDLLESNSIAILKTAYDLYKQNQEAAGLPLPKNKPVKTSTDLILRNLDCAVFEALHRLLAVDKKSLDTIRSAFWEGEPIYEGAGIRSKNHIQICVRNPECIKGYFLPLQD